LADTSFVALADDAADRALLYHLGSAVRTEAPHGVCLLVGPAFSVESSNPRRAGLPDAHAAVESDRWHQQPDRSVIDPLLEKQMIARVRIATTTQTVASPLSGFDALN
jgi:hypothetical protein